MNNQPPYNPYANCWAPCGHYNPNANCALHADDIIEELRPMACEPIYKVTYEPPCQNDDIYEIVSVQELDK